MHYKLTSEIINLSTAKNWDSAKQEWTFDFAYYSDSLETCLCGHYPIKNICVIKNGTNDISTEVGNCCINKFLGIDDGNKIFTSIKRLKEDISKSISAEVIDYMKEKKLLNNFEYKFYKDTFRKRKLSEKQVEVREKINRKFLNATSYELNSHFRKINIVLKWAENKSEFDSTFILSLRDSCRRNGKLTDNQKVALENIISRFKIN
jgi:hypothetical protein